ncbi:hypothetical protein PMAYCL1PPCAC_05942, partial [Pristionchus mayeri]
LSRLPTRGSIHPQNPLRNRWNLLPDILNSFVFRQDKTRSLLSSPFHPLFPRCSQSIHVFTSSRFLPHSFRHFVPTERSRIQNCENVRDSGCSKRQLMHYNYQIMMNTAESLYFCLWMRIYAHRRFNVSSEINMKSRAEFSDIFNGMLMSG